MKARRLLPNLWLAHLLSFTAGATLGMGCSTVVASDAARGHLRWDVYANIQGLDLASLTNDASFPDHPTLTDLLAAFETPPQWGDNYGARVSGYLFPPTTGQYVFYLCSDDEGALFLSADEQAAHRVLIARESTWSMPRQWQGLGGGRTNQDNVSGPIQLEAGRSYYIEALMKEAGGGDHVGVAWQMPGGSPPENGSPPIPGDYLGLAAAEPENPPATGRELHVVGVYSGAVAGGNPSPNHERGDTAVTVDRPGVKVTLLLSAYEPVLWHVTTTLGTVLERVILGGHYAQDVEGLPAGVEVIHAIPGGDVHEVLYIGYSIEAALFLQTVPKVFALTGLEIASFQGRYTAPYPAPFVVNQVQADPRLQSDYPQPTPLEDLPDLTFNLAFHDAAGDGKVGIRSYTLGGIEGGGPRLLPGLRVVGDGSGRYFYAAQWHRVLKVDSQTGAVQEMQLGAGIPELSWPMGVAYDSDRGRVLLATLGGEGYLYAYAPGQGVWSVVSSMENRDVDSLVFHASDGSLYALSADMGGSGLTTLYHLDAQGNYRGEMAMPLLPFGVGPAGYQSELVSVGDSLVLILEPDATHFPGGATAESRMYLIDPRTRQVWLTYRRVGPMTNQPPGISRQPASQTRRVGQTARFLVEATGSPPLTCQWQRDGRDLPGATDPVLTLPDVQVLDAGVYRVVISNSAGSITSAEARLTVLPGGWSGAMADQRMPAVAGSAERFLVAWADRRDEASKDWDIYATRVTPEGRVLEPGGLAVCCVADAQDSPAVASDGQDFLVVWSDTRGVRTGRTDIDIYGARVTGEGQVLDPNGFPICRAPHLQDNPAVAWSEGTYLVTWHDSRASTDAQSAFDIYGARVSASGAVLDPAGIPISTTSGLQWWPETVGVSGGFSVAWVDLGRVPAGLYGTFVAASGVVQSEGALLTPHSPTFAPALASNSTGSVMVWAENRSYAATGTDAFALFFPTMDDVLQAPERVLSNGSETQDVPDVAATGTGFLAVWMDSGTGGAMVRGSRLTSSGVWTPGGFEIAAMADVQAANAPAVASLGGDYLVAWVGRGAGDAEGTDVYATRVSGGGVVLDPDGILVSAAARLQPSLVWSQPEPIVYGTPLSAVQLNATASVPGAFVYHPAAGSVLQAGAAQRLLAVFTPQDTVRYEAAIAETMLDVRRAPLEIRADDKARYQGQENPPLTATYLGLVAGDTPSDLATSPTLTTTATTLSPPGTYPIHPSSAEDPNYAIDYVDGRLAVLPLPTTPGSVDPTFIAALTEGSVVSGLARQSDGKLVVVGRLTGTGEAPPKNIARLHPDGSLDRSFHASFDENADLMSLVVQRDDRILVAGSFERVNGVPCTGLVRLHPNGSWDPTFRLGAGYGGLWAAIRSVVLQPDGRIIIGGLVQFGGRNVLMRLLPSGRLDETFDAGEVVIWEGDGYVVFNLGLQSDGRILVHGEISHVQGQSVSGFFRLNPDGSLDRTLTPPWQEEQEYCGYVTALLAQSDGRIVLAGSFVLPGNPNARLARLNGDGSLDATFVPAATASLGDCFALARQDDGRLVVGGNLFSGTIATPIRLHANGSLDGTFSSGAGVEGNILRILIEPDGRILLAGRLRGYDTFAVHGLVRIHGAGTEPAPFVTRRIAGSQVELIATPPAGTLVYAVEDRPPQGWEVGNIASDGVFDARTGKVKFGLFFDPTPRTLSYEATPPSGFEGVGVFQGTASADGINTPITGEDHRFVAGPHPADPPPSDWALIIGEVTQYAVAWRQGLAWPRPPTPIPIDYVTRAAALWRAGECYTNDPAADAAPLCWVSCGLVGESANGRQGPQLHSADPAPVAQAVRRMPSVPVPGDAVVVTIEVSPGSKALAYGVEECLPAGCAAAAITADGVFDATARTVRWGPFFDPAPRALSYACVGTAGTGVPRVLEGWVSVDGVSRLIEGDAALAASCRLRVTPEGRGEPRRLELSGPPGRYVLEGSSDLRTWTPLATLTGAGAESVIACDLPEPSLAQQFYRARTLP